MLQRATLCYMVMATGRLMEWSRESLRKELAMRQWSASRLASLARLSRASVARILAGTADPSQVRVTTWRAIEQVFAEHPRIWEVEKASPAGNDESDRDAARAAREESAQDEIPVYNTVRAGKGGTEMVEGAILCSIPRRFALNITDTAAFGLVVRGSSMEPDFPDDSIVIISPNGKREDGQACYVEFSKEAGGHGTIKDVYETPTGWALRARNPNFVPQLEVFTTDQVVHVHPVVVHIRRVV